MENQWDEVSYELPSVDGLLNADHLVLCTSEFVTIQHFPKTHTWVTTHWGKIFITRMRLKSIDFYLTINSGQGSSDKVKQLVRRASSRYLQMDNNNVDKETFHFPTKNLWNENESDEIKYKKALTFVLDKISFTVPNQNPSRLLYRLINLIFYKKIF